MVSGVMLWGLVAREEGQDERPGQMFLFNAVTFLMFAGAIAVTARPLTPIRFFLTITVVGAGWFAAGSYEGLAGAFIYSVVVAAGSFLWLGLRWKREGRSC